MKYCLFGASLLLACAGVWAQEPPAATQTASSQPLHDLQQRRAEQEVRFSQQEAACWAKFAVNDCLIDIRQRRRAVLAELKQQEQLLSREERKTAASEQVRRLEEKAAEFRARNPQPPAAD
jgi:hypothetical protein